MPGLVGMDVEAIRLISDRLAIEGQTLRNVTLSIDQVLSDAGTRWRGSDFEQFAASWTSRDRPRLQLAIAELDELARTARTNSDQQYDASMPGNVGVTYSNAPGAENASVDILNREAAGFSEWSKDTLTTTFPLTADKIANWYQRLSQKPASAAELTAFVGFVRLAMLASAQRAGVDRMADLTVDSLNGTINASLAVGDRSGMESLARQVSGAVGDGVIDFGKGAIIKDGIDAQRTSIRENMVSTYSANADSYLASLSPAEQPNNITEATSRQVFSTELNQYTTENAELASDQQRLDYATLVTGHDDVISSVAVSISNIWRPLLLIRTATNAAVAAADGVYTVQALQQGTAVPMGNLSQAANEMGFAPK